MKLKERTAGVDNIVYTALQYHVFLSVVAYRESKQYEYGLEYTLLLGQHFKWNKWWLLSVVLLKLLNSYISITTLTFTQARFQTWFPVRTQVQIFPDNKLFAVLSKMKLTLVFVTISEDM